MWRRVIWPCALLLLTLFVYWEGRDFDYIVDDYFYVQKNAEVQAGLTKESMQWAFGLHFYNWHPLVWLSFMADVEFYGFSPRGFHTTNLLLHSANVILLFVWLRKLTGRELDSLFVAAVFAVHPLHVESVEWISARKDVLSMFFGLLTLLAWERYLRLRSRRQFAVVCLAFLASLMAKQLFVTLPVLLLLLDFWPFRRFVPLPLSGTAPAAGDRSPESAASSHWSEFDHRPLVPCRLRALLVEKTPLFLLTLIFCGLVIVAQHRDGAIQSLTTLSLLVRLANAVDVTWLYLGKIFWPTNLIIFYPHPGEAVLTGRILWELLGLIIVTVVFAIQWRRRPFLIVGWLWYVIALLPMIGIIQVGGQQMADRYAYLPAIGVYWGVTWFLVDTFRSQFAREWRVNAAVVTVAMLAGMAHLQVGYWRDQGILFEHFEDVVKASLPAAEVVSP